MLPKPYVSHDPMHGLPATCWPVWKNVMAGSWLIASVHVLRTIAISSAMRAVYGSRSEIQAPLRPYCLKSKTEGAIGNLVCPLVIVVNRCPLRIDGGKSWSNISRSFGL